MTKITTNTNAKGHQIAIAQMKANLAIDAQRAFLRRAMDVANDINATQEQKDKAMTDYENAKAASLFYKTELHDLTFLAK